MSRPGLARHAAQLMALALVVLGAAPGSLAAPADLLLGPFASAWLALGAQAAGAAERAPRALQPAERQTFALLVERLRLAAAAQPSNRARLDAWRDVVFGAERFTAAQAPRASALDGALLPEVLARRRGSCLGLGGLYLSLGERLGLPLRGVLAPGHFFVRLEQRRPAAHHNIELLEGGRSHRDAWYRRRYRIPLGHPLYLRSLSAAESLAVLRYELANALRRAGALRAARAHYRAVVEQLPDFAEAQANLGLTEQLLGNAQAARLAYRRALRAGAPAAGISGNLRRLAATSEDPPECQRPAVPAASGNAAFPVPTPGRPHECPPPDDQGRARPEAQPPADRADR